MSEELPSYDDPLTNHLRRLTEARAVLTGVDQPGGVYLRSASMISKEELIAMQGAARMVLIAARGTLRQQLAATTPVPTKPKLLLPGRQFREEPSAPLPFMELEYFNDLGGFTADGKEYVIYLGPEPSDSAAVDQRDGESEFRRARFGSRQRLRLVRQQPERSPHPLVKRSHLRSTRHRHIHP